MSEYIKKEDAVSIVLRQPFFQNSMATEIRQIKGIDIVRCKECVHCECADKKVHLWCDRQERYMVADDFCSYGEREGE